QVAQVAPIRLRRLHGPVLPAAQDGAHAPSRPPGRVEKSAQICSSICRAFVDTLPAAVLTRPLASVARQVQTSKAVARYANGGGRCHSVATRPWRAAAV